MRDLVPESQAYMDLLAFERKLDATIMRKRLDIQEALKRPMKVRHWVDHKLYFDKRNEIVFSLYKLPVCLSEFVVC